MSLEKKIFEIILFVILSLAGFFLLISNRNYSEKIIKINNINPLFSIMIGSVIGFTSGIVGIGGGIFLSPILFLLKAAYPKQIVTTASLFILLNSISGIFGQLTKDNILNEVFNYYPLFLAVLIGGQIGNFLKFEIFIK